MSVRKVLIGMTGSVGAVLAKKIVRSFIDAGYEVGMIFTERARSFVPGEEYMDIMLMVKNIYYDCQEWNDAGWQKDDPVLHIDLREEYDAFVIAPASANTIAKIANGICDNLLTCVARAWLWHKPMIIAPAMNSEMLEHPTYVEHIGKITSFSNNNRIVNTQIKMLACGQEGDGALANISDIVKETTDAFEWYFPLSD